MNDNNLKTILTVLTINILSWYEFMIYITLSPIIATIFFPTLALQKSLFYTLLIASITFIARIGGGLFFGKIADSNSKRKSLVHSVILMSIATICIALLPTYQTIGYASLLMLVIVRLIQSFCIGGEFGSSMALLMQIAPTKRIGLYGSIPMVGMGIGILLASVTSIILSYIPTESVYNWGWRIPFLVAGFFGVISLYLKKGSKKNIAKRTKSAFSFKRYKNEILSGIGLFSCSIFHLYLFCILIKAVMLSNAIQFSNFLYITIVIVFIIFAFVGGMLSGDRYCKQIFITNIILLPIYTVLVFVFHNSNFLILSSLSVGILQGIIPKMLYDILPKQHLASSLSLVNNLTAVIFGSALVVILQCFSMYAVVVMGFGLMVVTLLSVAKY